MHRLSAIFLAAALATAGCGTKVTPARVQASGGVTPKIDAARTYAWTLEPAGGASDSAPFAPVIRDGVDEELRAKGFTKVTPSARPGFKIAFATAVRDSEGAQADDGYFGGKSFGSVPVSYTIVGAPTAETGPTATIVVDARDPADGSVLWRGAAGRALNPDLEPGQRDATIAGMVADLMATFPASRGAALR